MAGLDVEFGGMTESAWIAVLIPRRPQVPCKASVALGAFSFGKAGRRQDDSYSHLCPGFIWCWPVSARSDGLWGSSFPRRPARVPAGLPPASPFSILSMALSGFLLWLAQRNIPIGTAYAVWTGIGALGTFMVGIIWFGDSSNVWRMLAATFLLIGIIGLKMAPGH